jgi:hypothetical protein
MELFSGVPQTRSNHAGLVNNICCSCKDPIVGPVFVYLYKNKYVWCHLTCLPTFSKRKYTATVNAPVYHNMKEIVEYIRTFLFVNADTITAQIWGVFITIFTQCPHIIGTCLFRETLWSIVKKSPEEFNTMKLSRVLAFKIFEKQLTTLRDRDIAITVWALRDTGLTCDIIKKIVDLIIF